MLRSVVLPYWSDRPPDEALAVAAHAARCGYPGLWVGEMATYDAFSLATALGTAHEGLAMTIGPLAVHLRSPVSMALGVASVRALTGCAVALAIGTSSPAVVERWHGMARQHPAARLEQTAREVRALLDGERGTGGFRLRLPAPSGPLTVAAFGERAVAVAARLAERVVLNLTSPEGVAEMRARLDRLATDLGRPRPRLAAWVVAGVDPGPEGWAQVTRGVVAYLAAPGYAEVLTRAGLGDAVDAARAGRAPRDLVDLVRPEACARFCALGDVGSVEARLAAYESAGLDEACLVPVTAGGDAGGTTLEALGPDR